VLALVRLQNAVATSTIATTESTIANAVNHVTSEEVSSANEPRRSASAARR
jgi:hypothetical protein